MSLCSLSCFFFFNDTATTEIYTVGNTLSLHDALPISLPCRRSPTRTRPPPRTSCTRSEEHTSELQSLPTISYAVFCLKKKKRFTQNYIILLLHNYNRNNYFFLQY